MRYAFPPDDGPIDPSWTTPLHKVTKALAGSTEYITDRFFDPHDFMIMCRMLRQGRPDLTLYKHSDTRRYLNLDDDGHAYRYYPPRIDKAGHDGQYRRHRDLRAAITGLRLWELPWMKPALEAATYGVPWSQRWELLDLETGDLLRVPDGLTGVIGPDECEHCREELEQAMIDQPAQKSRGRLSLVTSRAPEGPLPSAANRDR